LGGPFEPSPHERVTTRERDALPDAQRLAVGPAGRQRPALGGALLVEGGAGGVEYAVGQLIVGAESGRGGEQHGALVAGDAAVLDDPVRQGQQEATVGGLDLGVAQGVDAGEFGEGAGVGLGQDAVLEDLEEQFQVRRRLGRGSLFDRGGEGQGVEECPQCPGRRGLDGPVAGRAVDGRDGVDRHRWPGHAGGRDGHPEMVRPGPFPAAGVAEVAPQQDRRGTGVAEGGMRVDEGDLVRPAAVEQAAALQIGQVEPAGLQGAQVRRRRQVPPGPRVLRLEEGQIEPGVVGHDDAAGQPGVQLPDQLREPGRGAHVGGGDAVDERRADRAAGIHQGRPLVNDAAPGIGTDDRDLHHAIPPGHQPRGLHVDDGKSPPSSPVQPTHARSLAAVKGWAPALQARADALGCVLGAGESVLFGQFVGHGRAYAIGEALP